MQCTVMGIMLDEAHRALTAKNMMVPRRIFVNTDNTVVETKTSLYYIILYYTILYSIILYAIISNHIIL